MSKSVRIQVTWSEELQKCAELIVEKCAGEMGVEGIPTRVATRSSGEQTINRSGAIEFALKKICEDLNRDVGDVLKRK